ncbi:BAG family molecular chaperone regulator 1-like [Lotus japonicus]|uniref:BAG family molecular chaperone regulator 1-like n=1 Tax=Lotus japonicus TaxID=34305 RepID=UPI002590C3BE|nr:BAG family molecular chaperone regulator 1-like [Lotus japonicus]XP_057421998.1 BAG family molecular chaperone regulator 1-like [Lotus japonicus]XP_057421999.1 BAG family molecular chaperone regulator 1-like [Lotus japonicus]
MHSNKEATTKSTINTMFSKGHGNPNVADLELRPGGMVVQKRNSDSDMNQSSSSVFNSTIRVKVKYGSSYHEIRTSPHASFGELKKMLTEQTGLHVQDQKLMFKKKERHSKSYLDVERVKDGSKLVLLEDIECRERRILEALQIAKKEKTSKSLKEITHEVDKLAKKVVALEAAATTGGVAEELDVETLTENLMRLLIALDEIYGEGELKLQRREQVWRVQKHIETLDKLKNPKPKSTPLRNEGNMECEVHSDVQKQHMKERQGNTAVEQISKMQQQLQLKHSDSVVVTTKWEIFD